MPNQLLQAIVALGIVGAAAGMAATHAITGTDALALISAVTGATLHAVGVTNGANAANALPSAPAGRSVASPPAGP